MPATDQLRLVDHHCHGVIDHQPDGEEFRVLATEADRLSDPGLETLDSPYGLALKKHVFPLFGLGLEATYEAERIAMLMARGNAERIYDLGRL